MITSKKPNTGAIYLNPRDMRMNLIVPIETSHILAKNIMSGIITKANNSEEKNVVSISVILFIVIMLGGDKDDLISGRRIKPQYWAFS
jgi:hypothetical protein